MATLVKITTQDHGVLRFSGSEVYHRAETCVEEIDALLRAN